MRETGISRAAIQRQLQAFVEGRLTLDGLRRWFTPLLADGRAEPAEADHELVFRLVFLFEDESVSEKGHLHNAERLLCAMRDVASNAVLLQLIPLITDQDRLCKIVEKYCNAVITRTAFLSTISETRYSRGVKDWLIHSDIADVTSFCELLVAGKYSMAAAIAQL